MNVTMNHILQLKEWADAEVIGGQTGIDHSITWCNVVDMEKPWNWINPGELIFLSGIGLTDQEGDLCQLLTKMRLLKPGGLVVQMGYYIKEIPKRVLTMANEYEIPVIGIPFESRISNLTYQICQMLFQKEEERDTLDGLMKEVMYLEYDDAMESKLKFYGYNPHGYYTALAIEADQGVRNVIEKPIELSALNAIILNLLKENLKPQNIDLLFLQ